MTAIDQFACTGCGKRGEYALERGFHDGQWSAYDLKQAEAAMGNRLLAVAELLPA